MKSRSYKLSTNDDWVEESWTVDCVCGVNFDDGEEMVNCDDCGVWVHTRCSHYVKSEKSFACDKCKNRKTRNNSEETEVAQLLVELPTKTLRMDNPTSYGPPRLPSAPTLAPSYIMPCRQWTEIPIKERVHIQGIPGVGDDPSLFSGVSSVFGPQLWKCTGYIPKKFNFPYNEFPYWEDGEEDLQKKNGVVSLDVEVLVSSNSEIPSDPPEATKEGVEIKNGDVEHDMLKTPEQTNKLDNAVSVVLKPYLGMRKDQNFLQSSRVECGKRKENYGMLKDRSGKKKARTTENQGEFKKKNINFLGPASTNSSDVRKLQCDEERGHAAQKDDPKGNIILKSNDTIRGHQLSGNSVGHHSNDHKSNSVSSKNFVMEQSLDASIDHSTRKEITKEGKCGSSGPEKSEDLSCGISSEGQVANNSEDRLPTDVRINLNKSEIVSKDVPINRNKVQDQVNKEVQDNCELNLQPSPIVDYKSRTEEIQTQSEKIYVNSLQPEIGSDVEKKASNLLKKVNNGSVLSNKVEKTNQIVPMTSSKVNTSLSHVATSSSSPTTLTDEELALLLHQELNSSPRVPRVPRMRHAGSLPQLTSPTVSSLMKRTSSVGGKEHGLVPRRREKEFPKDNSHGLVDGDDEENKTTEWGPYLSDQGGGGGQDSGWTTLRHGRDSGNAPPRTLPGLIAEIMSKGQRMTYEELCNAVLPHWPNLRKHNGERYAYASHSQAVLDCLRNRNEWARLVDRGPKTCVGRRRRKLVTDLPGIDSEENEDNRGKNYSRGKSIGSSGHEGNNNNKREATAARKWSQKGRVTSSSSRIDEFSDDDEAESYLSCSEDDDTSVSDDNNNDEKVTT